MRIYIVLLFAIISCSSVDTDTSEDYSNSTQPDIVSTEGIEEFTLYFPPLTGDTWEKVSPKKLGWNEAALQELNSFVATTNTTAFIVLYNGRIVMEEYYDNINASTNLRWNSVAKTLTASTIGIAQEENNLTLDDTSSYFLGAGWTTMPAEQEARITIENQLTMTTGGDYNVTNLNCTLPSCLRYYAQAGSNWYYHNAFYTLLQDVVAEATLSPFEQYFQRTLQDKIGMTGFWLELGYANLYLSNARSMARFGLLSLNKGKWATETIVPEKYFLKMTTTSQNINKAYGYLWWLNGKESYKLPGSSSTFSGKLIPTAPDDLVAGLGLDDQKMYVVPSKKLVVIRLGEASGFGAPGPSGYDTELWSKIMDVLPE